jgi:hypothetical protein
MKKPKKQSRKQPRVVTEAQLARARGGKWYVPELDSDSSFYEDLDPDGYGNP